MKFVEIYLWCTIYLSTYLLASLIVIFLTGWGDLIGITLIGLILTLILAIILLLQDETEELAFEFTEPAEIVTPTAIFFENQELPEVKPYAEKEKPRTNPIDPAPFGVEPGTQMRTDVDLNELDAPDDDTPS